jgi:hypothetical protein
MGVLVVASPRAAATRSSLTSWADGGLADLYGPLEFSAGASQVARGDTFSLRGSDRRLT